MAVTSVLTEVSRPPLALLHAPSGYASRGPHAADDITTSADGQDTYAAVKAAGRYK